MCRFCAFIMHIYNMKSRSRERFSRRLARTEVGAVQLTEESFSYSLAIGGPPPASEQGTADSHSPGVAFAPLRLDSGLALSPTPPPGGSDLQACTRLLAQYLGKVSTMFPVFCVDDGPPGSAGVPPAQCRGTASPISATRIDPERPRGSLSVWPLRFTPTGWLPAKSR